MKDEQRMKICKKVEEMIISQDPRLADKKFRENLDVFEKMSLVTQMVNLANKILIFNS